MAPTARLILSLAAIGAIVAVNSCSSGLGNNLPGTTTPPTTGSNANLPVGIDLGVTLSDTAGDAVIAGLVVPAIGAQAARDVVLVAFTTATSAATLSRDTVTDGNGARDVFVAAVSAQDIETHAFSQSLAGKFRHPRCATCHSMQAADTTAFVSAAAAYGEAHAGPPPGPTFPNNDPATCIPCHTEQTTFPVPRWQAPAASFDLRKKTVAELALAAQDVPADEPEHFVTDPRVLWALDSGILPVVGGRNGRADDDQDGIDEPEDRDGTPRTVPGGSAVFIQQIEDWRDSGFVVTAADAVRDVTLASRATGGSSSGDAASTAPQVLWVPNGSFNPANAAATNPIGTLYLVYQSEATDIAGDGNGVSDVFRVAIQLRAEENATGGAEAGGLNLVVTGNATLCSAIDSTTTAGNGASTRPSIGGATGNLVTFESLATDLIAGFTDGNGGALHDVFVRTIGSNDTDLVSHAVGNTATGGDGSSERPRIDAGGVVVAFESDATDLIALDANGVRDVYYARIDSASPFTKVRASVTDAAAEASGGASANATVHESSGRVRVAFESAATNLTAGLTASSNVFLYDSTDGATRLLNQRIAPTGNAIGDGDARNAVIAQDGTAVAFESEAANIDVLRSTDINHAADVFLVDTAQLDAGRVLPYRISMTVTEAADGDGASTMPWFGTFAGASANYQTGFVVYPTAARNLGTSDSTTLMVAFVDETSGVIADFSASSTGGTVPVSVTFTDASTGQPTSWAWDFDNDGNVDSTEQNPTFVYTTPGLYTVKLVASNGNTDGESTQSNLVRATGAVTAGFSASPTSGALPLTVVFTDTSTESFGTISAWAWDFDGDTTIDSTAQNPSFDYLTQGTFSVTLTVTGLNGTSTLTQTDLITVDPPGPITADFTSVNSGYNDSSISFTDTSTGFVTSWAWNFGDGGSSTLQNPTHTFATPGTYTVSLTSTGPAGSDIETKVNWFISVPANEDLEVQSVADSTIYEDNLGNGNGSGALMVMGRPVGTVSAPAAGFARRALLRFDVSSIPAGSTINSASLQLVSDMPGAVNTGTQSVTLHRLTAAWSEGTELGGGGTGSSTNSDGATWTNRIVAPVTAWSSAGGDFNATASASQSVSVAGTYTWTSTGMRNDVSAWFSTPANNFGWLIRTSEAGAGTAKRFFTRENEGTTPGTAPRLTVNYTRPLP